MTDDLAAKTDLTQLRREEQIARTLPIVPRKEDAYAAMQQAHTYSKSLESILTVEAGDESAEAFLKTRLDQPGVAAAIAEINRAGIPLIMDLAANDQQRRILKLIISRQDLAYTFAAPPDMPPDRTAALRTAFDRTMKDPDFLGEAEKMGVEVAPMTGAEVDRLMKEIYETPADLVAEARRVISP